MSAALALAAEYDRTRSLIPWKIRLINVADWRRDLTELLDEIGFFSLLEIQRPNLPTKRSDVTMVQFSTGEAVGRTEASELTHRLGQMIAEADPAGLTDEQIKPSRLHLYAALVEATENTRHHAYPEYLVDEHQVKRWWMTGAVYKNEKRLTIVVYDQGATIPVKLRDWVGYTWIQKAFRLLSRTVPSTDDTSDDGMLLRLAMTAPRSSTGQENRGKGFPAFKAVVQACGRGRLRVVSRCGEYVYETGKKPVARQLPVPLDGTLVEWDLWL